MTQKISKICYNSKRWTKPSGTYGKSPDSNSYETEKGFGHEEWLFDRSKIINGFHYGFLQPLNLISDKHVNKNYNLFLYTIYQRNKFLVSNIRNAYCISKEESKSISKIYRTNGWFNEMVNQLEHAGVKSKPLKELEPEYFFNLKFQFSTVTYYGFNAQISDSDKNITTTRYRLLDKIYDFQLLSDIESDSGEIIKSTEEKEEKESKEKSIELRKRVIHRESEYDPYHDKIQRELRRVLKNEYQTVLYESSRVDLKAKTNDNNWHFFEIKTNLLKYSIREAIGQLMEYAYYPDKERASRLIIISDEEPDRETIVYLRMIRNRFKLPIYYRYYIIESDYLSEEY